MRNYRIKSARAQDVSLFLVSFLALFFELAFIRWLPARVLSLAYFSNIVLLSSFLGLGAGCLLARKRDVFDAFAPGLLATGLLIHLLGRFEVLAPTAGEWVWSAYTGNRLAASGHSVGILTAITLVFALNAALFVPLGQKMGALMDALPRLRAYALNVAGSLAGVAAFAALSSAGPLVWFLCASALVVALSRRRVRSLVFLTASCALALAASSGEVWSPYYSLRVRMGRSGGAYLFVNGFFHQQAVNFDADAEARDKYALPYQLAKPRSVLVLGAGTGNDVATALAHGAESVDAVEIDPVIARLGRELHPQRPYGSPKVRLHVTDARSFLQRSQGRWDMIVLGTLDSHALLSGMSTVRLDNFVYTEQSLRQVREHLAQDGVAVLLFSVPTDWLGEKMLRLCARAFSGLPSGAYFADNRLFNLMVVAGPGLRPSPTVRLRPLPDDGGPVPTDDWPYLYLRERGVPAHYLKAVALLAALSAAAVLLAAPGARRRFDFAAFLLGCGFLLLETKAVTTLSLVFGSTWLVNAFVFASVLSVILLGTLAAAKLRPKRLWPAFLGLGAALALDYALPVSGPAGACLSLSAPLFFAAVIFARHLDRAGEDAADVYGANLLGAMAGGFLEYASMALGLNALYLLAAALYALALWACAARKAR